MKNICPVCGYDGLSEPAYDNTLPSFEICPSCYFQYGYDDDDQGFTFEQWRNEWIKKGMPWVRGENPPEGWNPEEQLRNLEKL